MALYSLPSHNASGLALWLILINRMWQRRKYANSEPKPCEGLATVLPHFGDKSCRVVNTAVLLKKRPWGGGKERSSHPGWTLPSSRPHQGSRWPLGGCGCCRQETCPAGPRLPSQPTEPGEVVELFQTIKVLEVVRYAAIDNQKGHFWGVPDTVFAKPLHKGRYWTLSTNT